MSRKHGGLSRKDALKSRKGAGNKQDTTRRGKGDDELPAALVIPEDGNINNAEFVSQNVIRRAKRRGIDPFGPQYDKYRLEVVYDEQNGHYKTQPYGTNAKQALCPPSPPETPATRPSRERQLPGIYEPFLRYDMEGDSDVNQEDYTTLSSKHFHLPSPKKRLDPQQLFSPLQAKKPSAASQSSLATAASSLPSSLRSPVAGPSRTVVLRSSDHTLRQSDERRAARTDTQHKLVASIGDVLPLPAMKYLTSSTSSATLDLSPSPKSSVDDFTRERQLLGLYVSARQADTVSDIRREKCNSGTGDVIVGIDGFTLEDGLSDISGSWHGATCDENLAAEHSNSPPSVKRSHLPPLVPVAPTMPGSFDTGVLSPTTPSTTESANTPLPLEGQLSGSGHSALRDDARGKRVGRWLDDDAAFPADCCSPSLRIGKWMMEDEDDATAATEHKHSSSPVGIIGKWVVDEHHGAVISLEQSQSSPFLETSHTSFSLNDVASVASGPFPHETSDQMAVMDALVFELLRALIQVVREQFQV
ncbi:hypothetical protein QFC24_002807 [Naganishia onofrii]|uniref:Uncharacterized protein n=1 Tax=Naganishia onofrii TaxID=1851511 RepID=A0ACC2XMM1_9TREE|nr:hypothetical protein QFC24_002807 [Naganishia onofrii]